MADHFWSRWVREHLPTLLPRSVSQGTTTRDLRCGDIVQHMAQGRGGPNVPQTRHPRQDSGGVYERRHVKKTEHEDGPASSGIGQ